MLDDVLKDMRDKHVRAIEKLLKDMPVGAILCVHDPVFVKGEDDKYYSYNDVHIINEPYDCTAKFGRTQYGPKPEGM